MSYVSFAPLVIWRCLPVVAAAEIQYVVMTSSSRLTFEDLDKDIEYRKRIAVSADDVEIALVWCTLVDEGASVEFLVDDELPAEQVVEARSFEQACSRRARTQRLTRPLAGFGRW